MYKADITFGIDHIIQGHSSQLKEIHFLPVHSGNQMFSIGQPDKGNLFIPPILFKDQRRIGSHSQDFRAAARELIISVSQARQLRAAVRSHKAAQE